MILPWNRKEVYMGFDMQKFNQVLDALNAAHIRYTYRALSHSMFRSRSSPGVSANYSLMYYVYVRREDFDQACYIIRKQYVLPPLEGRWTAQSAGRKGDSN